MSAAGRPTGGKPLAAGSDWLPIGRRERLMTILWPSFVMAGVLETLVFVVVDPSTLAWFDGPALGWPRQAVYTVTFFIFWAAITAAGAMTAFLNRCPARGA